MRRDRAAVLVAIACVLAACGGDDTGGTPDAGADPAGQVRLTFSVSNGARASRNLVDELTGTIYGAIFLADEVSVTGPIEGAEDVASVQVEGVDLRAEGAVSTQDWLSAELPPEQYMFLGFFDVDASSSTTAEADPEAGDPVTLPVNEFEIKDGLTTPFTVSFDLIYN